MADPAPDPLMWPMSAEPAVPAAMVAVYDDLGEVSNLPVYDIMNGDPSLVRPYLQRSTVPHHLKWVPVGGVTPSTAMKCMDAFIKAHWYHIEANAPGDWTAEKVRKAAFLLGVCRCVMSANYNLKSTDFIAGEVVTAPINATVNANGEPAYAVMVAPPAQGAPAAAAEGAAGQAAAADARTRLGARLVLRAEETAVLRIVVRSAQGIVPIQGFNLMTDGHHYLSQGDKASFRAFLAIEQQVWTGVDAQAYLSGDKDFVRDLMWHKAGHPIDTFLKMRTSTMENVPKALIAAGLGSAATRLPAVESELKPIDTFLKLTEAVKPSVEMYGGRIDNRVFHDIRRALRRFPLGANAVVINGGVNLEMTLGPYVEDGPVVTVRNRAETIEFAKEVIERAKEPMAMCYGYFCRITESQAMLTGTRGADSLKKAHSLSKLANECPAQYGIGFDMATDYQAFRNAKRAAGAFVPPDLGFT